MLTLLREHRSHRDQGEVDMVHDILDWCVIHQTDDEGAASFGDHGIPLAGDGAPWVLEFAVMEIAAALGLSTDSGKRHVGAVLEVRYRLPRHWARVTAGDLPFWKATSIAEQTMCLPEAGAAFVDRHLARAAADGRHISVHTKDVGVNGMVDLTGTLDLRDATALGVAGCGESHDVRRSIAAGDLARGQQSLDFGDGDTDTGAVVPPWSQVVLHVHLTEAALDSDLEGCLARVDNTRSPIWADRVRDWCANLDVHVTVRPVKDLVEHIHVEAYEIPERLRVQLEMIDHHCVFPWCTRPARSCDTDHITPHDQGGTTCSCNTAPLCRGHHRAKTHSGWDYEALDEGVYYWRSPGGMRFRRDSTGTTDLTTRPAPLGEP